MTVFYFETFSLNLNPAITDYAPEDKTVWIAALCGRTPTIEKVRILLAAVEALSQKASTAIRIEGDRVELM